MTEHSDSTPPQSPALHVFLGIGLDGCIAGEQGELAHEMSLSWLPVVLGRGTRLFETGLPGSAWQSVGRHQLRSGMVQARYRRHR